MLATWRQWRASATRAQAVLALVVWLLCAPGVLAQPSPLGPPAQGDRVVESLERSGDLTLRNSTLEAALFTISELWGVNIVAGEVSGSVNGVFKDAPLREILDSILLSNGYAYRPVGGSLVVSPIEDLGQMNPFFVTATIPVGSADVDEIVQAARLLTTPQGQVTPLPSAGSVLVVDFPDRVEKVRDLVRQIDRTMRGMGDDPAAASSVAGPRQLEVAYFRTHYVPASQAAVALNVVLSSVGRVSALEAEDRLLVVDYEENVRMVEAVLDRLDRPRPQVNIKSLIYDISLSDLEQCGVNWDGITDGIIEEGGAVVSGGSSTGVRFLTQTKQVYDAGDDGGTFRFYTVGGSLNIQSIVLALQQAEDSRLLADPNVTVIDNETALVESVSEIPYQQLTQTGAGGNIGTTAFKEVGIKLDVTPKIARNGTIDMTVIPEFSRLAGFTPGDNQPITETRRATTRVRVSNGQTLMIAGLRQRADVGDFSGIPLLKDVRYFGHLFRARDTQIEESELVVFITPTIVGYSDPLSCRDRLTSDTVRCRLDHIPAAEGCGPFGPCGPEGCGPHEGLPAPGPTMAPGEEVEPEPIESASGELVNPMDLAPKRLPGVVPSEEKASPAWPLRPEFDARFRSTGGVYAQQQRPSERTVTPDGTRGPSETKAAKRSWTDRIFRR